MKVYRIIGTVTTNDPTTVSHIFTETKPHQFSADLEVIVIFSALNDLEALEAFYDGAKDLVNKQSDATVDMKLEFGEFDDAQKNFTSTRNIASLKLNAQSDE